MLPSERIISKIYLVRGIKVMFDSDLAKLYGVETKQLKRQVRRNIDRFPHDFMFELTKEEYQKFLRCQIGALEQGAYSKYSPMAFNEKGIGMLSTVLNSQRAIQVNIQIIRIFSQFRLMVATNDDLRKKIKEIEEMSNLKFRILDEKFNISDERFRLIFETLKELLNPNIEIDAINRIGFKNKEN